jgi:hypothetical protein
MISPGDLAFSTWIPRLSIAPLALPSPTRSDLSFVPQLLPSRRVTGQVFVFGWPLDDVSFALPWILLVLLCNRFLVLRLWIFVSLKCLIAFTNSGFHQRLWVSWSTILSILLATISNAATSSQMILVFLKQKQLFLRRISHSLNGSQFPPESAIAPMQR